MTKAKRITSLLISMLLLLLTLPSAAAAQPPDPERKGSITIHLSWQGQPLTGGNVTLYRVAELSETLEYVPEPEFAECGTDLSGPWTAQTARSLAQYAEAHGISGLERELDQYGTAEFGGLEAGLYLLVQKRTSSGYLPFNPFLVGIPMQIGDDLNYDIDASPKAAPEPRPTDPTGPTGPGTPPPPGLPQTGQTNWPIPVLGTAGLLLLVIGLYIIRRNRRES